MVKIMGPQWAKNTRSALADRRVRPFVDRALRVGYRNMQLPASEELVDTIFLRLDNHDTHDMAAEFEWIRNNVSSNWKGKSVRTSWSDYYSRVEAPFITSMLAPYINGNAVIEVGSGRGWIGYHLAKQFPNIRIQQTDVSDYREDVVRAHSNLPFVRVNARNPFPFSKNEFDIGIVVYVLHHVPSGVAWRRFVEGAIRIVRKRLIILEDTYLDRSQVTNLRFEQLPVLDEFLDLTPHQQRLALSFLCTFSNRVDGGGMVIPTPCTFKSFSRLEQDLRGIIRPQRYTAEFLGIPRTKVYLNAETLLVIDK